MALESNLYRKVPPMEDIEVHKTIKILKDKYARVRDKGRDKVPRDVPLDVGEADAADEMNLG